MEFAIDKGIFEFQRTIEKLSKPFEQKTEVTGHLLPGADISREHIQDFVAGAAAVTGMHIFGPFVYKDPTDFDAETFKQLGRPPRDINFSQMWSNSGMDGYIFPENALYATLKFHTCKNFDFQNLLKYVHESLSFDSDMRHTEIIEGKTIMDNRLYKRKNQLWTERVIVNALTSLYERAQKIEEGGSDDLSPPMIGWLIKQAVAGAIIHKVDQRVAPYFTGEEKKLFQTIYGKEEIKTDEIFMFHVKEGYLLSPNKHPLQKMYDRLSSMEVQAAGITKDEKILHFGSGYGTTGVGEIQQFGIPFTCVEVKTDVAQKCRDTFNTFGLLGQDKLQVACADAREVDPKGYDVIIISAMVPEDTKLQILDNISKLKWGKNGNRRLIIRTPSSPIQAFLYPVLTTGKFLSRPELTLITDTGSMCGPEDPLRSLVFTVSDSISDRIEKSEKSAGSESAKENIWRLQSLRPKLKPVSDFII